VLIKLHATYGGVKVKFHAFLTSAIGLGKQFRCKFRSLFSRRDKFPDTHRITGRGRRRRTGLDVCKRRFSFFVPWRE